MSVIRNLVVKISEDISSLSNGLSIEEISAALSVLYNAGYDVSMAGTTLRQALSSHLNPSG